MSSGMDRPEPIDDDEPITHVIKTIDDLADDGPVYVADMIQSYGRTAFAPVMMIPALLLVSPLSGFPLFSSLCGILIFLIAVQGAIGRDSIWTPHWIARLSLPAKRAHSAAAALARSGAFVDRLTRRRLPVLVGPMMQHPLYAVCSFAALFIPLMEFFPFSASLIGGGVSLIAVGILAKDGLFVLAGALTFTIAAVIPVTLVSAVVS